MAEGRRLLVITSCTGLKAVGEGGGRVAAERLYAGEQHRRLMRGVAPFRAARTGYELDLWIVSAGHGLIGGDHRLPYYDASFACLRGSEIDRHAEALRIPDRLGRLLARPYALALLLLGDDYMRAARLTPDSTLAGPTVAFGGARLARRLGAAPSLRIVPAGKREARQFSCGLVGLKGELAGRLLQALARRPELVPQLADPGLDVSDLLRSAPAPQPLPVAA